MANMTYFRRPKLIGTSLARVAAPELRGDLRRKNADGVSAVPYFDGLPSTGGTFIVVSSTNSTTVNLTATSGVSPFSTVLNELNSSLAAIDVLAFDSGGCVGLRFIGTDPGSAWVSVTGGTAAVGIGFNYAVKTYRSDAGDIASSPEGRIGNPFGSTLPVGGENFDTNSITRAFGRLMSNSDVLYSEAVREEVVVKKIGSFVGDGSSTYLDVETLSPGTRVFTGTYPIATPLFSGGADEIKTSLASYFFLVDQATHQPSWQAINDVRVGASSVLGVEQTVVAATPITSITAGEIVGLSSTTGVVSGDLVLISGATNGKWRNNGFRWVVDYVIDSTNLVLRPMSKKELELVATAAVEGQPITELSSDLDVGETYGTITVRRSNFTPNARLYLDNVVPVGQTVDVYAAVPQSKRDRDQYSSASALRAVAGDLTRTKGEIENAVLSRPNVRLSGASVIWDSFWIRRQGRVFRIPSGSMARPAAERTIAWNVATNGIVALSAPPATEHIILGYVWPDPDARGAIDVARVEVLETAILSVGSGGEFPDIASAVAWIKNHPNVLVAGSETKRYELLLLSDQSVTSQIDVGSAIPSGVELVIRGANSSILIENPTTGPRPATFSYFLLSSQRMLRLENVSIRIETPADWSVADTGAVSTIAWVTLDNVQTVTSVGDPILSLFKRSIVGPAPTGEGTTSFHILGDAASLVFRQGSAVDYAAFSIGPASGSVLSYSHLQGGNTLHAFQYADSGITLKAFGESDGVLTRANIRTLTTGVDADGLHTHPAILTAAQSAAETYTDEQFASTVWTAPTLVNGWQGGAAGSAPRFGKDASDVVHFKGYVVSDSSTPVALMFTLPAGSRPLAVRQFAIVRNGASTFYALVVNPDGRVELSAFTLPGTSEQFFLDGVAFLAEQ